MSPTELSQRIEKLEKQMGYSLGNQVSILELQSKLSSQIERANRKPASKNEFSVILNYFLASLVFYGLIHMG